ncbi:MAG: LytS/YhcK type 5TM receptor domain-containing protein [Burkholderiales bacterium]
MSESPVLAFIHNAALLLAMALVHDIVTDRTVTLARQAARKVFLGVVAGGFGIAVMLSPWLYAPDIVFDTRSVLLGVVGLYFGAVPAAIAMAMTAAFRLYQGGEVAWTGAAVIVASGLIRLAWRRARRGRLEDIAFGELLLFGVVVHVAMLALMLTIPWETAGRMLATIAIPVIAIYPLATAVLGSLLSSRMRRERLAERLAASEERLRLALDAAGQGLYDVGLRDRSVHLNPDYARRLGLDPAAPDETLDTWLERTHPEDRERVDAALRDYLAGRAAEYRVEFRQRMAGGEWRWILSRGSVVERDAAGAPLRMLGTHTDIAPQKEAVARIVEAEAEAKRLLAESDRSRLALLSVVEDLRAAEDRLGESEAFYRGLFENLHEGFAYCEMIHEDGEARDFTYLRVNPAFERMRGTSEIEGRRVSEVFPEFRQANPELFKAYARVAETGVPETLEANVAAVDRWFLVAAYSPRRGYFVSATMDITEMKRVQIENQQRLSELSRWYQATLGREGRVLELKAEVNALRARLGEPPHYPAALPGAPEPSP